MIHVLENAVRCPASAHAACRRPEGEAWLAQEAKDRFLEAKSHLRETTVTGYRRLLERFIRRLPPGLMLQDLNVKKHLLPFVRDDDSVSRATLRKRYRHVKAFLNWTVKEDHLSGGNPLENVRPPKREKKMPEFLTTSQLERWLRTVDADAKRKRASSQATGNQITWIKDAVLLAVGTGLCRSELVHLTWHDVCFESGFLTVRSDADNGFKTKSGHDRRVPIVATRWRCCAASTRSVKKRPGKSPRAMCCGAGEAIS